MTKGISRFLQEFDIWKNKTDALEEKL